MDNTQHTPYTLTISDPDALKASVGSATIFSHRKTYVSHQQELVETKQKGEFKLAVLY